MKSYPSIFKDIVFDQPVVVFDKLDGSNLRVEVTTKKGMYKFGSRNLLLDPNDSKNILSRGCHLIKAWEDAAIRVLEKSKAKSGLFFFEFVGPNSFAGFHNPEDIHRVVLIDACLGNKGFVNPFEFEERFSRFEKPAVLHEGRIDEDFVESVRNGTLPGMSFEGIVAKGKPVSPGQNLMFKIKNRAWLDKLRARCSSDAEFETLA